MNKLKSGNLDLLIGTHALFQKKITFSKLGFVIIDEQHKFGVKQRLELAKKGGKFITHVPIPQII